MALQLDFRVPIIYVQVARPRRGHSARWVSPGQWLAKPTSSTERPLSLPESSCEEYRGLDVVNSRCSLVKTTVQLAVDRRKLERLDWFDPCIPTLTTPNAKYRPNVHSKHPHAASVDGKRSSPVWSQTVWRDTRPLIGAQGWSVLLWWVKTAPAQLHTNWIWTNYMKATANIHRIQLQQWCQFMPVQHRKAAWPSTNPQKLVTGQEQKAPWDLAPDGHAWCHAPQSRPADQRTGARQSDPTFLPIYSIGIGGIGHNS